MPVSFLFVINELILNYDPDEGGMVPQYDCWSNIHPPTSPAGYAGENPSAVMRYTDGRVSLASGYSWMRDEWGTEGYIYSPPNYENPIPYQRCTVFACSPHLPIVVVRNDPTVHDTMTTSYLDVNDDESLRWSLLHFSPPDNPGISLANSLRTGAPYVAGKNPSWMPSLVPSTFKNPNSNAPPSRALGGNLPVVLGLMAFAERQSHPWNERLRRTFLSSNAHYRNRKWHHNNAPKGYPHIEDNPRGYLVHVCLDSVWNPTESTPGHLRALERSGLVRD